MYHKMNGNVAARSAETMLENIGCRLATHCTAKQRTDSHGGTRREDADDAALNQEALLQDWTENGDVALKATVSFVSRQDEFNVKQSLLLSKQRASRE